MSALQSARIAVMKEVGYVQKTSSPNLNYKYAGEQALIAALRPAMIEQGLSLHPTGIEQLQSTEYTTSNNKQMQVVRAVVHLQMAHVSGETMSLCVAAEASDSSDKATAKMMTSAYKYALRQFFVIETGDDGDDERHERELNKHPKFETAIKRITTSRDVEQLQSRMQEILAKAGEYGLTADHLSRLEDRMAEQEERLCRKDEN
jgi:hypothetical protein